MQTDQLKTCHLKVSGLSEAHTKRSSVGEDLRFVREEKGLSIESVSHVLRIPVVYLSALEADDFVQIPGSTYVKGYLRAYGRYLGIASDQLILKYAQSQAAQHSSQESSAVVSKPLSSNPPLMYHKKSTSPRLSLSLLMIGTVLFFSYSYWESADNAGLSPLSLQKVSVESANGELIIEDLSQAETVQVTSFGVQTKPEFSSADAAKAVSPVQNERLVSPEHLAAPVAANSEVQAVAPTGQEEDSFLSDSLSQLVDSITLQAQEPCWVKVTDSKGGTLHVALMEAGESKSLSGSGPFQLVLGNAKGIRVQFNGEEVDLEAYQHKQSRVAVLKLGS